ncbi:hypothetical protein MMC06_003317 [Schaereria dolodes]|nr:hypothetical protein [Schaereria dolodes]
MTSTYALAIASSASELQAPLLREFLQRYVSYRVFFNVSMPFSGYSMEFHLPYYALRQSAIPYRDSRPLRRCGRFITTRNTGLPEYLYEAQISVIVTGFDEWFWTAYCCTDTYFGSEKNIHFYHDGGPSGYDAPGGGDRPNHDPIWNPREYFLNVLSRRFRQITKEWSIVVYTIEDRLQFHEASIFYDKIHPFDGAKREASLVDDAKFSRTKEFTWIVELLRLLHNALTKTIESWENFEEGEIQYFQVEDKDILRMDWSRYLEGIEKDMAELRLLRTSLHQKIEMFDNKRNGLVNASVMVESRDATDQGRNIGLLTRVTVAYLPLSLGTGIFSMVIMPKQANWEAYALLLIFLAFLTLAIAFRSHAMKATAMGSWQWLKRAVTERF